MQKIKLILKNLYKILLSLFEIKLFLIFLIPCILTYVLIITGLDWKYFIYVSNNLPRFLLFTSDILGFLIAIFLTPTLYLIYKIKKDALSRILAEVSFYSVVLGYLVSTGIKIFTGRTSPPMHRGINILIDNSNSFHFGFMREQIIGGWPSSHATIIFALAVSLSLVLPIFYPKYLRYQFIFFTIAAFVSVGVTFGFHWLSEFLAGATLGSIIGYKIGKYFQVK
jgi:membrane-associated phospholipid phosphatase